MTKVFMIISTAELEVHKEVTLRLALNSHLKKWTDDFRVLIWGPTEKLAVENKWFQKEIKTLIDAGIEVYACKACSDSYGVSEELKKLGVNVEYTGKFTIQMLENGWKQLTF